MRTALCSSARGCVGWGGRGRGGVEGDGMGGMGQWCIRTSDGECVCLLGNYYREKGRGGGYYWALLTRKRHHQEHRPQRPTESSDPTQHAKGRTGDCPGPRKGATTRRNVPRGVAPAWTQIL